MGNLKRFGAMFTAVAMFATVLPTSALAQTSYSTEVQAAYDYAYSIDVTTVDSIDNAAPYAFATREQVAKMMVNIAKAINPEITADTTADCDFVDLGNADKTLIPFIKEVCQMGIMGQNMPDNKFLPFDTVNRAMVATMLSRILWGDKYDGGEPWYAAHMEALKAEGIMTNISNPMEPTARYAIWLMAQRSDDADPMPEECKDPMVQLSCALGLGAPDCPAVCTATEEEETNECPTGEVWNDVAEECEVRPIELDGNLEVSLSSNTPDAQKLPKGAQGIKVATFELTADEDIDLFGIELTRSGMGATNAVEDVALFTENGRVSKAKSFNSDDVASVTFSPSLTLKAGETIELTAVVSTDSAAAGGEEFAIALTNVDSSAESVIANYPIKAKIMEIGQAVATPVVVAVDGSVSDVKVGQTDAQVLKFSVKNNSSTKEDVELSSITFKENGTIDEEDELSNFVLWFDGEKVATTKNANDKYVTFNLAEAVLIEDGKTEKFIVTANVDGGADKIIQLYIDKELDVMATASKYGYVSITNNVTTANSTAVDVEAGELSLVTVEPTATEIRKDKDNLVIGELKFVTAAGKSLELDDFKLVLKVDVAPTTNTQNLSAIFENVELYNISAGGVYDLDCVANDTGTSSDVNDTLTCSDTDLGVFLREGTTSFQIRLDTTNTSISPAGLKFHTQIDVANDVIVRETADDTRVTDVTPSALSYKSITIEDSSATVTALQLPTAKSAVIGSEGVVLHKFEVSAGDSSNIEIDEIKVEGVVVDTGTLGTTGFNNTRVNSVKLYKNAISAANLLDTVAGSQIASSVATFDGYKVTVEKGKKVTFYVTVDVLNDVNQALDTITSKVTAVSAEDTDNDDVIVAGTPTSATTTLTIKGVGTLAVVADNTDTATNKAKNVLAGTTSDFVASYEFTATNEAVLIKDLQIDETSVANLKNAVSEIVLYANDKTTELARESVSSDVVVFDNVNITVEEGNENVYVKVVTHNMGKDQAGTQTTDLLLKLTVTDADGSESNKALAGFAQTDASNAFSVLPVRISNVAFVSSYNGINVTNKLTNGINNVAIIAITTDSSTNIDDTDGSSLKTLLTQIKMKESKLASTTGDAYTIEKINGDASTVSGTVAGGYVTFITTGAGLGTDDQIDNGTTVYYLVKVNVTKNNAVDNDDYLKLDFDSFTASQVEYCSDSTSANNALVTDLRIGLTKLDGTQINE